MSDGWLNREAQTSDTTAPIPDWGRFPIASHGIGLKKNALRNQHDLGRDFGSYLISCGLVFGLDASPHVHATALLVRVCSGGKRRRDSGAPNCWNVVRRRKKDYSSAVCSCACLEPFYSVGTCSDVSG